MPDRIEFEWRVSDPDPQSGLVHVLERMVGNDKLHNLYGPMPKALTDSFIRARRDHVHRFVTTRAHAFHIFEPRPQLLNIHNSQLKGTLSHDD